MNRKDASSMASTVGGIARTFVNPDTEYKVRYDAGPAPASRTPSPPSNWYSGIGAYSNRGDRPVASRKNRRSGSGR